MRKSITSNPNNGPNLIREEDMYLNDFREMKEKVKTSQQATVLKDKDQEFWQNLVNSNIRSGTIACLWCMKAQGIKKLSLGFNKWKLFSALKTMSMKYEQQLKTANSLPKQPLDQAITLVNRYKETTNENNISKDKMNTSIVNKSTNNISSNKSLSSPSKESKDTFTNQNPLRNPPSPPTSVHHKRNNSNDWSYMQLSNTLLNQNIDSDTKREMLLALSYDILDRAKEAEPSSLEKEKRKSYDPAHNKAQNGILLASSSQDSLLKSQQTLAMVEEDRRGRSRERSLDIQIPHSPLDSSGNSLTGKKKTNPNSSRSSARSLSNGSRNKHDLSTSTIYSATFASHSRQNTSASSRRSYSHSPISNTSRSSARPSSTRSKPRDHTSANRENLIDSIKFRHGEVGNYIKDLINQTNEMIKPPSVKRTQDIPVSSSTDMGVLPEPEPHPTHPLRRPTNPSQSIETLEDLHPASSSSSSTNNKRTVVTSYLNSYEQHRTSGPGTNVSSSSSSALVASKPREKSPSSTTRILSGSLQNASTTANIQSPPLNLNKPQSKSTNNMTSFQHLNGPNNNKNSYSNKSVVEYHQDLLQKSPNSARAAHFAGFDKKPNPNNPSISQLNDVELLNHIDNEFYHRNPLANNSNRNSNNNNNTNNNYRQHYAQDPPSHEKIVRTSSKGIEDIINTITNSTRKPQPQALSPEANLPQYYDSPNGSFPLHQFDSGEKKTLSRRTSMDSMASSTDRGSKRRSPTLDKAQAQLLYGHLNDPLDKSKWERSLRR